LRSVEWIADIPNGTGHGARQTVVVINVRRFLSGGCHVFLFALSSCGFQILRGGFSRDPRWENHNGTVLERRQNAGRRKRGNVHKACRRQNGWTSRSRRAWIILKGCVVNTLYNKKGDITDYGALESPIISDVPFSPTGTLSSRKP
jgi:hypothetical protein